jgi:hypothetical protein
VPSKDNEISFKSLQVTLFILIYMTTKSDPTQGTQIYKESFKQQNIY